MFGASAGNSLGECASSVGTPGTEAAPPLLRRLEQIIEEQRLNWRKSSHSSLTNCVEVADFRKSSHSAYNGNCVEAGSCHHGVAVRDTQDRDGPVLTFGSEAWSAFTAALKAP